MNIVIIGGSRGIGFAAAKELSKDGHELLLTGRNPENLQNAKDSLQNTVRTFRADITDASDIERLFTYCEEHFMPDGLILNAAAFGNRDTGHSVLQPSADELSEILDANVVAHYRIVRRFFPLLQKSGRGRIVFIGSTAGIRQDNGGIYGISKWALRSFAYNLREEAKRFGVGVSLINPGGTFTEKRVKQGDCDTHLLETEDLGIVIATVFRLSAQAVIEQLDIRPLTGDTY